MASVLWDMASETPGIPPADHLGLHFDFLWQIFTGPFHREDIADFATFVNLVIHQLPALGNVWTSFLKERGIACDLNRKAPILSPFLTVLPPGTSVDGRVESITGVDSNGKLTGRRNMRNASLFYTFTSTGKRRETICLTTRSPDPAHSKIRLLLLNRQFQEQATGTPIKGDPDKQQISRTLPAGRYFVEVRSWSVTPDGKSYDYNVADFTILRSEPPRSRDSN